MELSLAPRFSFIGLLAALVALLIIQPFLPAGSWASGFFNLLFSIVLLAALATASGHPRTLILSFILATPALLLRWLHWVEPTRQLALLALASSAALLALTSFTVIVFVMQQRRVTADTISGGVCGYLLLGVTWALLMAIADVITPGAFASSSGPLASPSGAGTAWFGDFIYMSFVTLTTLGYGDITPISRGARMLSGTEAVFGQLYITIFIARLVALHVGNPGDQAE